jgi:predicted PurR-regulated permease PerM
MRKNIKNILVLILITLIILFFLLWITNNKTITLNNLRNNISDQENNNINHNTKDIENKENEKKIMRKWEDETIKEL